MSFVVTADDLNRKNNSCIYRTWQWYLVPFDHSSLLDLLLGTALVFLRGQIIEGDAGEFPFSTLAIVYGVTQDSDLSSMLLTSRRCLFYTFIVHCKPL